MNRRNWFGLVTAALFGAKAKDGLAAVPAAPKVPFSPFVRPYGAWTGKISTYGSAFSLSVDSGVITRFSEEPIKAIGEAQRKNEADLIRSMLVLAGDIKG